MPISRVNKFSYLPYARENNVYSTRPTFWWILNSFFQTSLLVLWFWYYIVKQLKLSTYFSKRNWRKHLTVAAVLSLVLIESLFNKSSSISLSSGTWNIFTTVYAYKKIFGVFFIATDAYTFCCLKGWVLNNGNMAGEYDFKSAVTILRLEHISCSGHV